MCACYSKNRIISGWIALFTAFLNRLERVFFANKWYTMVTLLWLLLVYVLLLPLLRWMLWDAVWFGNVEQDCHPHGACWLYVSENFSNFIYGTFPRNAVWRIHFVLLLSLAYAMLIYCRPYWYALLSTAFVLMPLSWYGILYGAFLSRQIPTSYWGGFSLNLILSMVIVLLSFPVGLLLALARQSRLPVFHYLARGFIDIFRGLPLVTVLFFASLISVYFFPEGKAPDKFIRICVAGVLFGAAYMAEAIRGGIQAVGVSQQEAAYALGLHAWQRYVYVVLPQAIYTAFPALINLAIALFKDTTLVSIVAMMDVLAIMQSTVANARWMRYFVEGYVFVAILFWLFCMVISYFGSCWEQRNKLVC